MGKAGEGKSELRPQRNRNLVNEATAEGSSVCEPKMYSWSLEEQLKENSLLTNVVTH